MNYLFDWHNDSIESARENEKYLTEQLITYIGNKRSLLDFIGRGVDIVRKRLNKDRLDCFDVFSGSGVVSRYLKKYSSRLFVNDMENYARIINSCYLRNASAVDHSELRQCFFHLTSQLTEDALHGGFISELYAPLDMDNIKAGERCFYTPRNARYLDTARTLIQDVPPHLEPFLLAPLLSEASVHTNTSGVFKGFYKNAATGRGAFGGTNKNALQRILGDIQLQLPIFSNFESDVHIFQGDSNQIAHQVPPHDLAYLDPPYNQHPYGSNYFMLNVIADYVRPENISEVSGIPDNWNRSAYNKKQQALQALGQLIAALKAKFVLISFNSEGFISSSEMLALLNQAGKTEMLETTYNTFRGSRNLDGRSIHVTEYLYLLQKN